MRLFLALDLPDTLRGEVAAFADDVRVALPDRAVRWVPAANLHLTLVFLGEQPPERVPDILTASRQVAAALEPLELELHGSGRFSSALWVGVRGQTEALAAAVAALSYALARPPVCLPPEGRPFHPHVTIGRFRNPRRSRKLLPPEVGALGRLRAREVILFHSVQVEGGVRHDVVQRLPFGATAR